MTNAAKPFPFELSREARTIRRSLLRDLIGVTARPGMISFAGGLPAGDLFPVAEWRASIDHVLDSEGPQAMQYGPPYGPLRQAIANLMTARGAPTDPDRVFITTGAQQGLQVAARLLLDHDSCTVVDRFVFPGVRQAFGGADRILREVPSDAHWGVDVSAWQTAAAATPPPRAAVVIPDFHNPMGISLDDEGRAALLAASVRYGVPLIEDDPYGWLGFDGAPAVPLVAAAPDHVIYVGSFSKLIAPALRLGWIVAPQGLADKLRVLKESLDLETSALTQRALATFLAAGHLSGHLKRLRARYAAGCSVMSQTLAEIFPPGTRWSRPQGGMFMWVELPHGHDTVALLPPAIDAGVAFVPGAAFSSGTAPRTMRLNFSNVPPDQIRAGLTVLADVLRCVPVAA